MNILPLEERIGLLHWLREHLDPARRAQLMPIIQQAQQENPWFIARHIHYALDAWYDALAPEKIQRWLEPYKDELEQPRAAQTVGLVLAGNIPLVGLHDVICTLVAGHRAQIKLSSKDRVLMNWVLNLWYEAQPALKEYFRPVERLQNFDAVIATGSNQTIQVLRQYFGKYPNILRGSRTSVAILTGKEQPETFRQLGDDTFIHFGLGCRNISSLWVPKGYDFAPLLKTWDAHFAYVLRHEGYSANYDYYLSVYLLNQEPHIQARTVVLKASELLFAPVAVLHYREYSSPEEVDQWLQSAAQDIQCVVAEEDHWPWRVVPGTTQRPDLWDYADHVDTMRFLLHLHNQ